MRFGQHCAAHDGVGNDGIDLDRGDVAAAARHGAGDVIAASRPDDQSFCAGTQSVGKSRPLVQQIEALARRQAPLPIESSDSRARIGVDLDGPVYVPLPPGADLRDPDAGEAIPRSESLGRDFISLGYRDIDEMKCAVGRHERDEQKRENGGCSPRARRARVTEPDSCGDAVQNRRGDDGVRSAEGVEQGNQQEAACGGAGEIEKIGAIHALHRF